MNLTALKGSMGVICASCIVSAMFASAVTVQVKNAQIEALKRKNAEAAIQHQQNAIRLSERITAQLEAGFKRNQERLDELERKNDAQMHKIITQYAALGTCHNLDGISLLNDEIRKRNADKHSEPAAKF